MSSNGSNEPRARRRHDGTVGLARRLHLNVSQPTASRVYGAVRGTPHMQLRALQTPQRERGCLRDHDLADHQTQLVDPVDDWLVDQRTGVSVGVDFEVLIDIARRRMNGTAQERIAGQVEILKARGFRHVASLQFAGVEFAYPSLGVGKYLIQVGLSDGLASRRILNCR